MIACIGNCFAGPSASSQDFFNFNVSISSCVGGFRTDLSDFLDIDLDERKPGGSGRLAAFFDRVGGGLLSSTTHPGGGGICSPGIVIDVKDNREYSTNASVKM